MNIPKSAAIVSVLLIPSFLVYGQAPVSPPPGATPAQSSGPLLSPDQLDNLVAPVALYPDPLLSEVLAASTYPLEITEAQQWLQQNRRLAGAQLENAAKQQNWDPSVQALVVFPDALNLLAGDIRWTTDLGNAFLAQQADVTSAVQRMRQRARANGKLQSGSQEVVTTETQNGQPAIEIMPTNPQVIYVPVYEPEYIWGPPVWGAYPSLWYPPGFAFDFGFGFGPGIYISSFFPGWAGWGGWGWGVGWFGGNLFVNVGFFNHYGFRGVYGGGFGGIGGRTAWAHDPSHRMGVPYPNQAVASRFHSDRFTGAYGRNAGQFNGSRYAAQAGAARSNERYTRAGANASRYRGFSGGNRGAVTTTHAGTYRGATPGYRGATQGYGGRSQAQTYYRASSRTYRGAPSSRGAAAYSQSSARAYSAPRSFSGSRSFSAPRSSFAAPRSSGAGIGHAGYSASHAAFSGGHAAFSGGHAAFSGGHAAPSGGHAGTGAGRRR